MENTRNENLYSPLVEGVFKNIIEKQVFLKYIFKSQTFRRYVNCYLVKMQYISENEYEKYKHHIMLNSLRM